MLPMISAKLAGSWSWSTIAPRIRSSSGPLGVVTIIATVDLFALVATATMAWAKFARKVLPADRLLAIAPLALKNFGSTTGCS